MARIIRETNSDRFNKLMISSLVSAAVTFLIGLLLFIFSESIEVLVGFFVGLAFIYSGVNTLYKYLKRDGAKLYSLNLIFSILMLILGIVIIFMPRSVVSFVMVCVGLYFVVLGANKISYGIWFKIGNDSSWLITCVIGILLALFGILILANPFESSITTTKVISIFMMLSGVLDFSNVFLIKKRRDQIVKIFW